MKAVVGHCLLCMYASCVNIGEIGCEYIIGHSFHEIFYHFQLWLILTYWHISCLKLHRWNLYPIYNLEFKFQLETWVGPFFLEASMILGLELFAQFWKLNLLLTFAVVTCSLIKTHEQYRANIGLIKVVWRISLWYYKSFEVHCVRQSFLILFLTLYKSVTKLFNTNTW